MRPFGQCAIALLIFGLSANAFAQEQKSETQTVEAKLEKPERAKFIDFGTELGTSNASVESLGEQIDEARLASNPVALVMKSKLLAAAEAVSGKKAKLTSQALQKEAVDLAKLRADIAELNIVAELIGGDVAKDLKSLAEATADKQPASEEDTKDLEGTLIVDNHSHSELHVIVDGYEIGHVLPHSVAYFHVHHAHHALARDHYGHQWVAHFEYGHYHDYRMLIMDPHHPH